MLTKWCHRRSTCNRRPKKDFRKFDPSPSVEVFSWTKCSDMPAGQWNEVPRGRRSFLNHFSRQVVSWLVGSCAEVDDGDGAWPIEDELVDAPVVHAERISRFGSEDSFLNAAIDAKARPPHVGSPPRLHSISSLASEVRFDDTPLASRRSRQSRISGCDARSRGSQVEDRMTSPVARRLPNVHSPKVTLSPRSRRMRSFTENSYGSEHSPFTQAPVTRDRGNATSSKYSPTHREGHKNSQSPRKNPSTSPRKRSLPCERKKFAPVQLTQSCDEMDQDGFAMRISATPRPYAVDIREKRSVSVFLSRAEKRPSHVNPKILKLQQDMWGPQTDRLAPRSVSLSYGVSELDTSEPPYYPNHRCFSSRARFQTDTCVETISHTEEIPTPRMRLRTESWVGRRTVMEDEEVFVSPEPRENSSGRSTRSRSTSVEPPHTDTDSPRGMALVTPPFARKRTIDCEWFAELQNFLRATVVCDIMHHWSRVVALLDTGRTLEFPFKMLPKRPWQSKRLRDHLDTFVRKWQTKESKKREDKLQMLVIGSGPVGLRTAIAAAANRYKVSVWEKRGSFARINRLHLWDFVGRDLIELNAKLCECEGSNFGSDPDFMHVGTSNLQALLLKNALLLGIDVKFKHQYMGAEAAEKGMLATTKDMATQQCRTVYTDVLVGCDGCNSAVIDMVGKYIKVELANATGLVANFVNAGTNAPRQFSYARQYYVSMFKKLEDECGAQLENIVYYRGNTTHYFVMTCSKRSLLQFGAISSENTEVQDKLREYTKHIVRYFGMPEEELTFVEGAQACSTFDFSTTMRSDTPIAFHSDDSAAVVLVGDALMEPFWPEGLGCIRGFFSGFDALAALDTWQVNGAAAAREQALTSYKNLKSINASSRDSVIRKDIAAYRIDPETRYCR